MAKIVWTEPALNDLDAIADYIALDNPHAARELVRRVRSRRATHRAPDEWLEAAGASWLALSPDH